MKKIISIILTFTFIFAFTFFDISISHAQNSNLTITLSPNSPQVGSNVVASVNSYSTDLDRAEITWLIDKKIIKKGFGEKETEFVMPRGAKNLLVKAVSPDGQSYVGGVSLLEKSVSIVWEGSDSYIPDWYQGKKQVASGGKVRVVAIANIDDGNGNYLNNTDLIFTWEVNGDIVSKASGLGKYYADIPVLDEYGDSVDISVTVKTRLTGDTAKVDITVPVTNTDILIYQKDNVYGILKRAITGGLNVTGSSDVELVAEPFFFSVDSLKYSNMKYSWTINGKAQAGNNYARNFKIGSQSGSASISVYAEQIKKLMQDATRNITLSF